MYELFILRRDDRSRIKL